MKALIQTAYGEPKRVLELQQVPDVVPGPGEVAIAMEAAVVHVADLHTVTGRERFRKPLPRTPGYEGIGRVLAVGSAVEHIKMGDRVLPPLGSGTHREQLTANADSVIRAPEGNAPQLALLTLNSAAAFLMLQSFVTLQEGDWIIQNAANSSVGRVVLQLAHQMKLHIVNVVKSPEVGAELHGEGATVVLVDDEDLVQRVATATLGALIRVGLDAVGGAATARLAGCLGEGGTIVNYGAMSGHACEIPGQLLAARDLRLVGFNTGRQLARYSAEECSALYERLGTLLSAGALSARLAAVYPIERAIEAYNHTGRVGDKRSGKVVIQFRDVPTPSSSRPAAEIDPPAPEPARVSSQTS